MMKCLKFGFFLFVFQACAEFQTVAGSDEGAFETALLALAHEYVGLNERLKTPHSDEELREIIERLFSKDFEMTLYGHVIVSPENILAMMRGTNERMSSGRGTVVSEKLVALSVKDRCFYTRTVLVNEINESQYEVLEVVTSQDGMHINSSEMLLG